MPLSSEDVFNVEVIKLLIQVAWQDEQVTERERVVIQGLGRHWKVPEEEMKPLLEDLSRGKPRSPPDLGILRSQPVKVLSAASALASADGRVDEEEEAILQEIASLLNIRLEG